MDFRLKGEYLGQANGQRGSGIETQPLGAEARAPVDEVAFVGQEIRFLGK
jgi:hypothetical protein